MKKIKVVTVVGTRPEIIRLSRVIPALDKHFEHIIIHTGQNYDYELNQIFFDELEIRRPDYFLNCANGSVSPSHTVGNLIIEVDKVLEKVKPDALLILGDTNSCLAVIPAKRRKISIFHMEAGNRCFDMRVPEEINRRIVDHVADINLTYSAIARDYLLREGLNPDQIIKTGSPMFEVLNYYALKIEASTILSRLKLKSHEYYVVSAHREETIESHIAFTNLVELVNSVAEDNNHKIIFSVHPRTRKKIDVSEIKFHPLVHLLEPLGFLDYVKLQKSAKAVLSDSGTINEEASILNFPALNLREMHERPEAMEEAAVMMVGLDLDRVRQGLEILNTQSGDNSKREFRLVSEYASPNVSEKIVRIILSYTDYVKRVVWKEY